MTKMPQTVTKDNVLHNRPQLSRIASNNIYANSVM